MRKRRQSIVVLTVLLALGLAPRIAQYIYLRALWPDEIYYGANLAVHTPLQMVGVLFYDNCTVPPAFMAACKGLMHLFGPSTYAVRFPAFVGSVAALLLIYPMARRYTNAAGAAAALFFMAICTHLIYYAAELRQYGTDAATTVLLLWMAAHLLERGVGWKRALLFGVLGGAAPWLAYPAPFFLAGVGIVLLGNALRRRDARQVGPVLLLGALWLVGIGLLFWFNVRPVLGSSNMEGQRAMFSNAGAFLPIPPTSLYEFKILYHAFFQVFENPCGFTLVALAAFVFVYGLLRLGLRRPAYALVLVLPVGFALAASALSYYPFYKRSVVYLTPLVFLVMGEGIAGLWRLRERRWPVAALAILVLLGGHPGFRALRTVVEPTTHHELHKTLAYAFENREPGDRLYLYHHAFFGYYFLNGRYPFPSAGLIIEPYLRPATFREHFRKETLAGKGLVWVPFTYDLDVEMDPLLAVCDELGTRRDAYHARGSSVFLYEFPPEKTKPIRGSS